MNSGVYQIIIKADKKKSLLVGRLGEIEFNKGVYIYSGSAKKNLMQRVERHHKKIKKLHWHIDYLLNSPDIRLMSAPIIESNEISECILNTFALQYSFNLTQLKRFGSSDCRNCFSHLVKLRISLDEYLAYLSENIIKKC